MVLVKWNGWVTLVHAANVFTTPPQPETTEHRMVQFHLSRNEGTRWSVSDVEHYVITVGPYFQHTVTCMSCFRRGLYC
jgi:hypothetical protein